MGQRKGRKVNWYQSNFLLAEFLLSILIGVVFYIVSESLVGRDVMLSGLEGARSTLYGTLASLGGSLFGFILAGISIIAAFGGMGRFKILRDSGQFETIFHVYYQAIVWLAITVIWSLVGLLFDSDASPNAHVFYVLMWLVTLSALRIGRCVWLLRFMMRLSVQKSD